MTKKKILTLAMTLSMVAILAIGGTIAYFTDTDYNKNVMVLGNVMIDQIESEKDGSEYVDNKPLYPVTENPGTDNYIADEHYYTDPNAVDKFVTVKNIGTTDAFVRTFFAFERGTNLPEGRVDVVGDPYISYFYDNRNGSIISWDALEDSEGNDAYIEIDGVEYVVGVYYYNGNSVTDAEGKTKISALAPNATSHNSLTQVYLRKDAGNEFYDYVGENYDILVLSQAVQTEGFATAEEAFEAAYGEPTHENLKDWFETYTDSHDQSAEPTPAA